MALLVNVLLGLVLVVVGLGIYLGAGPFPALAAGMRARIQAALGEDFQVHDWIFAGLALLIGGLALVSAFMMWSRSSYFFVL